MVHGRIDPATPTLVRMHMLSVFTDVFAENSHRTDLLSGAMQLIGEARSGVIVLINRPGPGFASRMIETASASTSGRPDAGSEQRDYGAGSQILTDLGVRQMILLTNTHHSLVGLEGYGLSIVGERPIEAG